MKHELFITTPKSRRDGVIPLCRRRLDRAKRAFVTRNVDLELASGLVTNGQPRAGDILLAQVLRIGHHQRLEDPNGRRAIMFQGDDIVVAYGDRYAPDQFEAHVPDDLGACDLVASGGIASRVVTKSDKARAATRIQPVGLLVDMTGRRLNAMDFAIAATPETPEGSVPGRPRVVAVVGSSMNAGKTTAMAALIQGECRSGRQVAAIKVTGTGSGNDLWSYRDAGATLCLDFSDAGHAATYRLSDEARIDILDRLLARARTLPEVETILVEVADGLLFDETERLVLSEAFRGQIDAVLYAAADAMGALSGADWLMRQGLPLVGLTGVFTASPLAIAEVAARSSLPIFTCGGLADGALALNSAPGRDLAWTA